MIIKLLNEIDIENKYIRKITVHLTIQILIYIIFILLLNHFKKNYNLLIICIILTYIIYFYLFVNKSIEEFINILDEKIIAYFFLILFSYEVIILLIVDLNVNIMIILNIIFSIEINLLYFIYYFTITKEKFKKNNIIKKCIIFNVIYKIILIYLGENIYIMSELGMAFSYFLVFFFNGIINNNFLKYNVDNYLSTSINFYIFLMIKYKNILKKTIIILYIELKIEIMN